MARNFSKPDIVTEESENEIENGGDVVDPNEPRTQISDLKLPETTVIKMMKEMLPKHAIVSQEAKDVMRRMPTIFVLFITDQALQVARRNKRRTILPEDIVEALEDNDFGSFAGKVMPVVERRRANYRRPKPNDGSSDPNIPSCDNAPVKMDQPTPLVSEVTTVADSDSNFPSQTVDVDPQLSVQGSESPIRNHVQT